MPDPRVSVLRSAVRSGIANANAQYVSRRQVTYVYTSVSEFLSGRQDGNNGAAIAAAGSLFKKHNRPIPGQPKSSAGVGTGCPADKPRTARRSPTCASLPARDRRSSSTTGKAALNPAWSCQTSIKKKPRSKNRRPHVLACTSDTRAAAPREGLATSIWTSYRYFLALSVSACTLKTKMSVPSLWDRRVLLLFRPPARLLAQGRAAARLGSENVPTSPPCPFSVYGNPRNPGGDGAT